MQLCLNPALKETLLTLHDSRDRDSPSLPQVASLGSATVLIIIVLPMGPSFGVPTWHCHKLVWVRSEVVLSVDIGIAC